MRWGIAGGFKQLANRIRCMFLKFALPAVRKTN